MDLPHLPNGPARVEAQTDRALFALDRATFNRWANNEVEVTFADAGRGIDVHATTTAVPLLRIHLRFPAKISGDIRILADHWERGYGDLEWRGIVAERICPWFFLLFDGAIPHGYGVATGAASLAFWKIDNAGISLWLDVRNGARGVALGNRRLKAAHLISYSGTADQSPFDAARQFCK